MIELLVAVLIISIVLLSGTIAIDFALSASNTQRLRVEATTLATSKIEQDEQDTASLNFGQTVTKKTLNTTTFTITTNVVEQDQSGGTVTTVCTSSAASQAQQIWQVEVSITWPHMNGAQPVTQSTEVAPGTSDALDLTDGEIAVGVDGVNGLPLTTALNFTVTPNYIPGGAATYPTPTGQTDPAGQVFNTGNNGCGVVTGLSTNPSWDYIVTLTGNAGWVSSTELSDANIVNGNPLDPTATLSTFTGAVSRVSPPFQMALGVSTAITQQPVSYSCSGGSPAVSCYVAPASPGYPSTQIPLPVTFGNTSLPGNQYTFGTGTAGVPSSGGVELLYPYPVYDVWSGDMAQSSPGATVVGTGTDIYSGPGNNETPSPVILTSGAGTAAVSVPTYDLPIQVTSYCAGSSIVATEQSGAGYGYTLSGGSGSWGMPLGQYLLSSTGGSGCPALTSGGGLYIWITPTGIYQSATQMTSPYSGTAVTVTAGVSSAVKVTE